MLAAGADVNAANPAGQTALMMAALMGRADIVPLLLEAGADIRLRDNHGFTALEWSRRRGFSDVTQLLAAAVPPSTPLPESSPLDQAEIHASGERFGPQELGPATKAVLKTVHANLEAQRQMAGGPRESPEAAFAMPVMEEKNGQGVELAPPVTPDIREERIERGRLFAAGLKKIQEEVRAKIRQQLPTADLIEPEPEPEPEPMLQPDERVAFEAAVLPGPESLATPPAASTPDASWSTPELEPSISLEDFAAGATTEPLTVAPTAPLSNENVEEAPVESTPPEEIPVDTQREFSVEEEVEPETVQSAKPVQVAPVEIPQPILQPADPDLTRSFKSRHIFDLEEPAPVPLQETSNSVARPILWILVIATLLGSVVLTYFITNRLMNGGSAGTASAPATTATAPASANPAAPKAASAPITAGALAGAEIELPEAEYPAKAKSEGTSGAVTVLVRVNRAGGVVISAQALNGDRQLRDVAEKAAKAAKFAPGKLPNESKVVAGTITYIFGSTAANRTVSDGGDSPVLGGALIGTGLSIPNADYPDQAKNKGLAGAVMVVVRVNRFGEVIAARPLNGDGQLRAAAAKAARRAKFSRDKLPKESLVTSGTITYTFKPQQATAVATNTPAATTPQIPAAQPATPANDAPVVGGDLAGKELNIPKAEYPAGARSKGISGTVTMLIRVNREGRVISWRTLNGDPLLRPAALSAAKKATFSKEKLGDVTSALGTITYTFKP